MVLSSFLGVGVAELTEVEDTDVGDTAGDAGCRLAALGCPRWGFGGSLFLTKAASYRP